MRAQVPPDVVSEFICGRSGLDQLVHAVVATDRPFDDEVLQNSSLRFALRERVQAVISRAAYDPGACHEMHSVLNTLYGMRLSGTGSAQELSVSLFEVRRLLEMAWLSWELDRCANEELPLTAHDFRDWFFALTRNHPAARHPLYEHIAHEAGLAGFRTFISQESTVDARFDDLLALAQLGFAGEPKLEIARNYWDELGKGEASYVHTSMFRRVLDAVDFAIPEDQELDMTALACGNLLLMLTSYRTYSNYAIGALGITEALAPRRFARVLKAGERLGIDPSPMEYFREHVSVDVHHTRHWVYNVIEPTLRETPAAVRQVCDGVLMRLNTSVAYCDALLARLREGECCAATRATGTEDVRGHA
jgi:hypothetical protein